MEQNNRESLLNRVASVMAPLFAALAAPMPARIRVAIGLTSSGRKGKAIGECWDNRLSADGHFEIFIRPDLAHAPDAMPAHIAAILAHELVHAAVGIPAGGSVAKIGGSQSLAVALRRSGVCCEMRVEQSHGLLLPRGPHAKTSHQKTHPPPEPG